MKTPRFNPVLVCLIVALGAALLLTLGLRFGVAISPDVYFYIGGARGFVSGEGFSLPGTGGHPIVGYPPLTSFLIALLSGWGARDLFSAARDLDILFFSLSSATFAWILFSNTRSWVAALYGTLLFTFGYDVIQVHGRAWSEPGLIFFGLLGLHYLSRFLTTRRTRFLIWASVSCTAGLFSRFAGITLFLSGNLILLFCHFSSLRARFKALCIYNVIPLITFGAWVFRNLQLAGHATSRGFTPHVINWHQFLIYWDQVVGVWLMPSFFPMMLRLGVVILLLGTTVYAVIATLRLSGSSRSWIPFLIHPMVFYLFLNVTQNLLTGDGYPDFYVPEYQRYFSTIYGPLLIGVITLFWNFFHVRECSRRLKMAFGALAVALLLYNGARGSRWTVGAFLKGHDGGTVEPVLQTRLMQAIRIIPSSKKIYFLGYSPRELYVWSFRYAKPLTGTPEEAAEIRSGSAVVVYLESPKSYLIPNGFDLGHAEDFGDGAIFRGGS